MERPLREQLTHLRRLQLIDEQILDIEAHLEVVPEGIARAKGELDHLQRALDEARGEHRRLEDLLGDRRREIDLETIRLRNTRKKESAIQNQREMEAYVREISAGEQALRDLEAQAALLEQQVKLADTAARDREATYAAKRKEVDHAVAAHDEETREQRLRLEALIDEQEEVLELLTKPLRTSYERILEKSSNGLAMAYTDGGVCSACHMRVPLETYNKVQRAEAMFQCPACRRILLPEVKPA